MGFIFIDCEADGPAPGDGLGFLTEFGAVDYKTKKTFHGILWELIHKPETAWRVRTGKQFDAKQVFLDFDAWLKEVSKDRPIMVSDNPAYDFQWINHGFHKWLGRNPLGHSARRIGDFYAGLCNDFYQTQNWKNLRVTPHDHDPVHDAMGNVEAFERMLKGEKY